MGKLKKHCFETFTRAQGLFMKIDVETLRNSLETLEYSNSDSLMKLSIPAQILSFFKKIFVYEIARTLIL